MRYFLLFSFSLFLYACGTNRSVYQSPEFEQASAAIQTVAVLPVKMMQTGHVGKNDDPEKIKEANNRLGFVFQESLHSYALDQTARNKKGPVIKFQSVQKTNGLLQQRGWTVDSLYLQDPEVLAKVLGVDAVIMTTVSHNKNVSDGVAYGVAAARAVVGAVTRNGIITPGINASDVRMNCALHDRQEGRVLWKTFRNGGTDLPANVDDLVQWYAHWIARRLPYRS